MIAKLFEEDVSIDKKSANGLSPLHIMVKKSRRECTIELLCLEAKANITDNNGNTPLHLAAMVRDFNNY